MTLMAFITTQEEPEEHFDVHILIHTIDNKPNLSIHTQH